MITPRQYQTVAVEHTWDWFREHSTGNPLIAMPTGTGKSIVIGKLITDIVQRWPGNRVLMLTHVKELIEQNYEKLIRMVPKEHVGIYSAGIGRRDYKKIITLAGIQSIYQRALLFREIKIVIIDEAHLVPDKTNTTYRRFLSELLQYNPNLRVIGLTATPFRLGLGMLTDGGIFDDIAIDQTTPAYWRYFIDNDYLCRLIPKQPGTFLDTSNIQIQNGDFAASAAVAALDSQGITEAAIKESIALAANRRSWLVFAASIEYAERIATLLRAYGVSAGAIHSKMSKGDRERMLQDYKSGKIKALVNRDVLTTGFDDPKTDCLIMLRPTQSPGLHVQMLGRGTRPYTNKPDCLVLDFAGNTSVLGPIDRPSIPTVSTGTGKKQKGRIRIPMMRACPTCAVLSLLTDNSCSNCGHIFTIDPKHAATAYTNALLSGMDAAPVAPKPQRMLPVSKMMIVEHTSQTKKKLIRITYQCGARSVYHYVGFGHPGFLGYLAREWWIQHGGKLPYPRENKVVIERQGEIRCPKRIKVDFNKQPPRIVDYEFQQTTESG